MVSPISLLKLWMRRMAGEFLTRWRVLRASSNWLWMYRLSVFFFGFTLYQYLFVQYNGAGKQQGVFIFCGNYRAVGQYIVCSFLYTFQSFGKAHFGSDFRFQSFAVCKSMEQFVVETGNGVAVGIKTDRIVLGNGTQDSRCRYFCIIAGADWFQPPFSFWRRWRIGLLQGYPSECISDIFSYRPSIKEIPWKAEFYHSRIDWVVRRQEVIGFPEPALTWYIIIKKRVRFKCRLA